MLRLITRFRLHIQNNLAWLCFPVLYFGVFLWLKFWGYRIKNQKKIRQQFRQLPKHQPLLICANHLTYVDSLIIAFALGNFFDYWRHFSRFPWNLPKKLNVKTCWYYPLVCYLGKCIGLSPEPQEARKTMQSVNYLLSKQQSFLIFPEGTRSDSGRVNTEHYTYGIGDLLQTVPDALILAIYCRGEHQKTKSKLPKKGECFDVLLKHCQIETKLQGRRASKDLASQIIEALSQLEADYFANANR